MREAAKNLTHPARALTLPLEWCKEGPLLVRSVMLVVVSFCHFRPFFCSLSQFHTSAALQLGVNKIHSLGESP
ncbi:hypothetical protein Mal65_25370 [Crateriforma conspicua]|nr:hypothetical protein Mal65_25370 [Crateriforma conspicua]